MECNKDEAAKAKELAEKKFLGQDLLGAKKFAYKAQALFPELDGLPQLLATLDVYAAAEKKINGEVDCYGVLGVHPIADDDAVRKQYRRLALTLHPDKNKSVGAEGAFKILSEAWSILSDKDKRAAYDRRRIQKVAGASKVSGVNTSSSATRNGLHTSKSGVNISTQQKGSRFPHAEQQPLRTGTFWTACTLCRMQYEYVKQYLNQMLMCPNCRVPFFAMEMPPPQMNGHNPWPPPNVKLQPTSHPDTSTYTLNSGFGRGGPSCSSSAAGLGHSQPTYGNTYSQEARVRAGTLEEAFKRGTNTFKRGYGFVGTGSPAIPSDEKPSKKVYVSGQYGEFHFGTDGAVASGSKPWSVRREPSILEVRSVLINKAKMDISQRVDEWKRAPSVPLPSQKKPYGGTKKGANKSVREKSPKTPVGVNIINSHNQGHERNDVTNGKASSASKPVKREASSPPASIPMTDADTKSTDSTEEEEEIMDVPDADFFDFDKERSEDSFIDNQVWAAYDDDDKMPRFYAFIHEVISRDPFQMRISWLESKNTSEFGSRKWVDCGFQKPFGDFKPGRKEKNDSVNSFSHKMSWSKGNRGIIKVYPKKGDVWALYRNWSPEWDEHAPDDVVHKYDMVVVLEEYDEEKGMSVAPLIKVAGYKTVFRQQKDPDKVRTIPKGEMLRFSHLVPSHWLTGEESPDAPKDCWELDPAAMPMELLKVGADDEEELSHCPSKGVVKGEEKEKKKEKEEEKKEKEEEEEEKIVSDGKISGVTESPRSDKKVKSRAKERCDGKISGVTESPLSDKKAKSKSKGRSDGKISGVTESPRSDKKVKSKAKGR